MLAQRQIANGVINMCERATNVKQLNPFVLDLSLYC